MYLIEESIEALQEYLQRELELKDIEEELGCNRIFGAGDSAWQDFERFHPEMQPIMQYGIKTPVQFIEELKAIWEGNPDLANDEFVRQFVVSAFRQTIKETDADEGTNEKSDVSLPTYIYNF